MLERREMMSAAGFPVATGMFPVISVGYIVDGDAHFESTDPGTGIQTQIWFDFEQGGEAVGSGPTSTDWLLAVSFVGPDGSDLGDYMNASEGAPAGISVSISPDLGTLRVEGDFDPVGDGTQLWLDVQWTMGAVTSQTVSQGLDLNAGGRTWTDRTDDVAAANAVAAATWVVPPAGLDPRVGGTALDLSSLSVDPGSTMEVVRSDTRAVPAFYDVGPLIGELSPPARAPAGANVSAEKQQYAGVELLDPSVSALPGNYWLISVQDYFTNPAGPVISGGFLLPDGLSGGTPDGAIDPGALFASDNGSGLAGNAGAADPTPNIPFSVDLQVTAIPSTVDIAFSRTVTTTADTVAIQYGDTKRYQATAEGSLSIDLGGAPSPVFGGAETDQLSWVTVIIPRDGAVAAPTAVSQGQWDAVIVGPWSGEAALAGSHGFIGWGGWRVSVGREISGGAAFSQQELYGGNLARFYETGGHLVYRAAGWATNVPLNEGARRAPRSRGLDGDFDPWAV